MGMMTVDVSSLVESGGEAMLLRSGFKTDVGYDFCQGLMFDLLWMGVSKCGQTHNF